MAETWTVLNQYNSFPTLPSGFTDFNHSETGGSGSVVWSVGSNILEATPSVVNNSANYDYYARLGDTPYQDQRGTIYTGYSTATQTGAPSEGRNAWYMCLRFNCNGGSPNAINHYILGFEGSGFGRIYAITGGTYNMGVAPTYTNLLSVGIPWQSGHKYIVDGFCTGVNPTTLSLTVTDLGTAAFPINKLYGPYVITDTTAALQHTGLFALNTDNVGGTAFPSPPYYAPILSLTQWLGHGIQASPDVLVATSFPYSISLTGTGTTWNGATTFSLPVNTNARITGTVIGSATTATITLSGPPMGTIGYGTVTIQDNTTGATCQVYITNPVLPGEDANIFLSPFNWRTNADGSIQCNNVGAYVKLQWSGSYCDFVFGTQTLINYPAIVYSLDNATWTNVDLTYGQGTIVFASSLVNGLHTLELLVNALVAGNDNQWTAPGPILSISTIHIDGSTQTLTYPNSTPTQPPTSAPLTVYPNRMLVYSDASAIGKNMTGVTVANGVSNYSFAWPPMLGKWANAEYGLVAFDGWGWVTAPNDSSTVPTFPAGWANLDGSTSRLVQGLLSPAPNMILILLGQADADASPSPSDASVAVAVATTLAGIRNAAPSAYIFVIPPFSNGLYTAIQTGVQTYTELTSDRNTVFLSLGTLAQSSMSQGFTYNGSPFSVPVPNQQSWDGRNPKDAVHGQAAARIAWYITQALNQLALPCGSS